MAFTHVQHSYNAGEVGEMLYGRGDDQKYASALARCKNATVLPQGPVQNRAGLMYVNSTKETEYPVRLIPFVYNSDQTYVLEFGHHYIRFHMLGQTLLNSAGTAVYEVTTDYDGEDLFDIHYVQNADIITLVHPDYPPRELQRYDTTDWRLEDLSLNTDLTAPTGVTAVRITEAESDDNAEKYTFKYCVTSLNSDRTEESERSSVASVVANLYATGTTVQISWNAVSGASWYRVYKNQGGIYGYIGETDETSIIDDNIAAETGTTPPYLDDIFGTSGAITSVSITNSGSNYAPTGEIASVSGTGTETIYDAETGSQSATYTISWSNLAPDESLFGDATTYGIYFDGVVDPNSSGSGVSASVTVSASTGSQSSQTSTTTLSPGSSIRNANTVPTLTGVSVSGGTGYSSGTYVRVRWVGISGSTETDIVVLDIPVELSDTITLTVVDSGGSGYGASLGCTVTNGRFTSVWIISGGRNYTSPSVVISGYASGSGATFSLATGTGADYPAAVGYYEQRRIFAGSNLRPNYIWMTASGTESNMSYHLPVVDTDRINFAVASQEMNRIRHIIGMSQLLLFTSSCEWRISPLNSDAITPSSISVRPQAYIGASNVSPVIANSNVIYAAERGSHIREFSYNYNAGGFISGDLSIRAPHFFPEDNPPTQIALQKSPDPYVWVTMTNGELYGLSYVPEQSVGAWFEYETDGAFESVCVINEAGADRMYVVVRRTINGETRRFIERMNIRSDSEMGSGLFLDCAGQFSFGTASTRITGATWLAGAKVTLVADGIVYKDVEVASDGSIDLDFSVTEGWVGLPYETVVKTLPVVMQGLSDGSSGRGHIKNITKLHLRLYNTTGIDVGPDEEHMKPMKVRSTEAWGAKVALRTGEIEFPLTGSWARDGSVVIKQDEPAPFTLLCHSAEVEFGG